LEAPRGYKYRRGWEWPAIIISGLIAAGGLVGVLDGDPLRIVKSWLALIVGTLSFVCALAISWRRDWRP
jgi:hypothetical protein